MSQLDATMGDRKRSSPSIMDQQAEIAFASKQVEKKHRFNPDDDVDERLAVLGGFPTLSPRAVGVIASIRTVYQDAGRKVSNLVQSIPGYNKGRLIASLDALQIAKDTAAVSVVMSKEEAKKEPIPFHRTKVFFALDIEADGASLAHHSMRSIGIVVFDEDGKELEVYQANIRELRDRVPEQRCMVEFWDKEPEAWKFVNTDPNEYAVVMWEIANLYSKYVKQGNSINWVAGPAAYDWQWLNYYYKLAQFSDPVVGRVWVDIGYSCRCASEVEKLCFKLHPVVPGGKTKEQIKDEWAGDAKHTHKPHEDARREGRIFFAMHEAMGLKP